MLLHSGILSIGLKSVQRHPLLNGMVEYFSMDETTGNRVGVHAGTVLVPTGVFYDTGKVGNAARFDDTELDVLTATPCPSALDFGGDAEVGKEQSFTIALWIYEYSLSPVTWTYHYLVCHAYSHIGPSSAWCRHGYQLQVTSNNGIAWFSGFGELPGSPSPFTHIFGVNINTWYWIVACYDAVNKKSWVSNYPNNSTGTVFSTSIPNGWYSAPSQSLSFGHGADDNVDNDGLIDEVGFWNRLLTEPEKAWLYNGGNGRSYAEIAAYTG